VSTPEPREDLEALHRRLHQGLMAFFLRRVGNRAEAEDLTQEVFVRLSRDERTEMRHADAYIFQIAANLLRDRGRRQGVSNSYLSLLEADEQRRAGTLDSERILLDRERLGEVVAALQELSERTRSVFLLSRLEGMKHREIADAFGITVSAVQKHLIKAIAHLALRIGDLS